MPRLLTSIVLNPRRRIVIVGANFAGLSAAQQLGREYAVTVIDRSASLEAIGRLCGFGFLARTADA